MIFLVEHNRSEGELVSFQEFPNSSRSLAEEAFLNLEIKLNRSNVEHEVVLLEAPNKTALLKTHRRYFDTLKQMILAPI